MEIGFIETEGEAKKIIISGNYAFVACHEGDLRVIDISDPKNPVEAAMCEITGYANRIFIHGNYLYVAGVSEEVTSSSTGLHIIDISDPLHPVEVRCFDTNSDGPWGCAAVFSGNLAHVPDGALVCRPPSPADGKTKT